MQLISHNSQKWACRCGILLVSVSGQLLMLWLLSKQDTNLHLPPCKFQRKSTKYSWDFVVQNWIKGTLFMPSFFFYKVNCRYFCMVKYNIPQTKNKHFLIHFSLLFSLVFIKWENFDFKERQNLKYFMYYTKDDNINAFVFKHLFLKGVTCFYLKGNTIIYNDKS